MNDREALDFVSLASKMRRAQKAYSQSRKSRDRVEKERLEEEMDDQLFQRLVIPGDALSAVYPEYAYKP